MIQNISKNRIVLQRAPFLSLLSFAPQFPLATVVQSLTRSSLYSQSKARIEVAKLVCSAAETCDLFVRLQSFHTVAVENSATAAAKSKSCLHSYHPLHTLSTHSSAKSKQNFLSFKILQEFKVRTLLNSFVILKARWVGSFITLLGLRQDMSISHSQVLKYPQKHFIFNFRLFWGACNKTYFKTKKD